MTGAVASRPLARFYTLVLSNGAALRLPIATADAKTRVAVNDVFSHPSWAHRIPTDASMEAEKNVLPDLSDFYAKFAGGSGRAGAGAGRKGAGTSRGGAGAGATGGGGTSRRR